MLNPFDVRSSAEARQVFAHHTIATTLPREDVESRLRRLEPWRYRLLFSNGADTAAMERMQPWVEDIHEKVAIIWPWVASDLRAGFSVLDVGCGPAHHRFSFRALGCGGYTGIEPVERNVRLAKAVLECCGGADAGDTLIHADAAEVRLDRTFDLVVCLAVLNNVDNIYGAVRLLREAMGNESVLVLENLITERVAHGSYLQFMPNGYMNDSTLRWIPNLAGVEALLRHFGFAYIEHKFRWTNENAIGDGMAKIMTVARLEERLNR
jgi:SAM-dependent methyltransferase